MTANLIVDIDGTLIDSNYQHVIAWQRAFLEHDVQAEAWTLHRYIGKGGDQLVESAAGPEVESSHGDSIRKAESGFFQELIEEVRPFDGASSFLRECAREGAEIILASSAKAEEVDHYLDLLDVDGIISGHTSSADVDTTKPSPDLIEAALSKVDSRDALMIGDSIWDIEAASRARLRSLAVLTGGFSKKELEAAGALEVQPHLKDLQQL
ncbi:MAG: HAD family hydrolase [Solirubrobacterales bacterium]|nr:HAD family hydrolase [Solirubrobacterales bacterium]